MTQQRSDALKNGHIVGHYKIISMLGEGGFSIAYLAQHIYTDSKVVIKEYLPEGFGLRNNDGVTVSPQSTKTMQNYQWGLERFRDEAKTLEKFCNHPNIVTVRDYLELNGTAYLIMQYEYGQTFEDWLKKNTRPTEEQLLQLIIPVLDGLREVHNSNYLHRDIKPANIYIRSDGRPMLIDFGAARQTVSEHSSLLRPHTDGYAPYEQQSQAKLGPCSDIYSIGATLWTAVNNGAHPVSAHDRAYARLNEDNDPLTPAIKVAKGRYSEDFLKAIDAAMAFLPKDRPQNIEYLQGKLLNIEKLSNSILLKKNEKKSIEKEIILHYSVLSNVGGKEENQDYHKIYGISSVRQFIVADGLGGQIGGGLASKIATEKMLLDIPRNPEEPVEASEYFSPDWLAEKFEHSHHRIKETQARKQELSRMATTMTVLMIMDGKAIWGHVGDSRLYLFRNGAIYHQTKDHSVPQMLVNSGEIQHEDIRYHPDRNRLLRTLGDNHERIQAEMCNIEPLQEGDAFLLCTKGFWEYVLEDEMLESLYSSSGTNDWLTRMESGYLRPSVEIERRRMRLDRPENDNYTAIAVWYGNNVKMPSLIPRGFLEKIRDIKNNFMNISTKVKRGT